MIKFFKHSYIAQLIVIVLLLVALWIPACVMQVSEMAAESPITPIYNLIVFVFGSSSLALTLLSLAVFVVSMLLFNSILSVNQLVIRNSSIGAFIFVLSMSCVPIQDEYYPFLLACPFIMMVLQIVYLIYQIDKPEAYLMNAGFFIALASMIYFPSILLIFWVLIAMFVMDVKEHKHFVIPIVGFLFPYFILFVCFYFNHTLIDKINEYSLAFKEIGLEKLGAQTADLLVIMIVLALTWLSLMVIFSEKFDNSLATRKKVDITIWLFVFGFIMLFIHKPVMCNGLIFMVLAVFVSMVLSYVKKTKIINVVLLVMMCMIIANQYLPLLGIKL